MRAEEAAMLTVQNENNFSISNFFERVIVKAIQASAFSGGNSCTIDLRGPSFTQKDGVKNYIKEKGYSIGMGMRFNTHETITINWGTQVQQLKQGAENGTDTGNRGAL